MPMTERVIDISDGPARLSVHNGLLVIEREGESLSLPPSELAALVVSHPAVVYTQAVLSAICAAGGAFVLCDEKRLPAGMLLPLQTNSIQAERFAAQAAAPSPTKKQSWKQLVQAKIAAQGALLLSRRGDDFGLIALSRKVRSGDPENLEGRASRQYWPALFGKRFRRDPFAEDQNRLLNYGYAVMRAMVARSICATGLHPSLGVHHHNRYDPFCLADDLLEPFRPSVDGIVAGIVDEKDGKVPLHKETKASLIGGIISARFELEGASRNVFEVLTRAASSLAAVFEGKRTRLLLPAP